jgi:hypothetical protein
LLLRKSERHRWGCWNTGSLDPEYLSIDSNSIIKHLDVSLTLAVGEAKGHMDVEHIRQFPNHRYLTVQEL